MIEKLLFTHAQSAHWVTQPTRRKSPRPVSYDMSLILSSLTLLLLGLVMVASASINIAQTQFALPLYYFWRQLAYAGVGVALAIIVIFVPVPIWQRLSVPLLLLGLCLLIVVLIPGIGYEVNGSMRWMSLGGIRFQPSEAMKLFTILYMAGYLIRRREEVREALSGFLKPIAVVCLITSLLLFEPDYGAIVVLFTTVLGMLFLAGVPMRQFLLWVIIVTLALGTLIVLAPYRVERLTTFINPWADPFNSGFQLTQALIAIGRGGLFGVGLGNSVQKLAYLPEAHTDFLFAILAEELGLVGVIVVIGLFAFIVLHAFAIAIRAERKGLEYASYLAYGIGLIIGLQASTNLGVNMGLLPTKGLTLPLMSYGGSSLIVTCVMLALLLRVDYETRLI
ncbi:MAG: putative lipid II flippase FtsW [Candidatus Parabeggiatoa sp. nov. 2]|nr:MAG: putative lipid II flippase FtsW [Beggiatoa sp. 4572_84]RKZ62462.1 MAG: putative lipid II flippase FtsW [Gammaproteobacteria bacterium]